MTNPNKHKNEIPDLTKHIKYHVKQLYDKKREDLTIILNEVTKLFNKNKDVYVALFDENIIKVYLKLDFLIEKKEFLIFEIFKRSNAYILNIMCAYDCQTNKFTYEITPFLTKEELYNNIKNNFTYDCILNSITSYLNNLDNQGIVIYKPE